MSLPSRSFRLVCSKDYIPLVEALLRAEGYYFSSEPFSSWCRILTKEPRPLGSSLAAFFGYIYIQDRSSMLPPLALQVPEGAAVLDMCASPGSKTGFLAQLTGNKGFVLGNEPSKTRLATLRANIQCLGFLHVATCSVAGEQFPVPTYTEGSWHRILLDPPCSGWGTVDKNPKVRALWHGDKIKPLITLQRVLLQKAWELLCPGGELVYSTCTTNVEENEKQVRYAVETCGFEIVPLLPFSGFVWEKEESYVQGTLRVDGERSGAQGFYIAHLRKPHDVSVCCAKSQIMQQTEQQKASTFTITDSLPLDILQGSCIDNSLLPQGQLVPFGETVRFVPQQALTNIPASLQWQAAPLGKFMDGGIRLIPRCKSLMPLVPPQDAIVLEKIEEIRALLQGQSLRTELVGRETGLYFGHNAQALPLGRLALKKGRALWTGR